MSDYGWWHPRECVNKHDDEGRCLDAQGYVVGSRERMDVVVPERPAETDVHRIGWLVSASTSTPLAELPPEAYPDRAWDRSQPTLGRWADADPLTVDDDPDRLRDLGLPPLPGPERPYQLLGLLLAILLAGLVVGVVGYALGVRP